MDRNGKLAIVVATVALAAFSGHLMQQGRGGSATAGAQPAAVMAGPAQAMAAEAPPPAAAAEIALPAAAPAPRLVAARDGAGLDLPLDSLPVADVILAAAPTARLPASAADTMPPAPARAAPACTPALSLSAEPGAMIALALAAPCAPLARVVVRHEGLAFTARTDAEGALALSLPALAVQARVRATLPGNDWVAAEVAVPEAARMLRVGLQWMGPDHFELHAFEGGAGWDDAGHVRAGSAPGMGTVVSLGTGEVERPLFAEIYSLPRDRAAEVRLQVEAPVTAATCGREMLAETIAMRGAAPVTLVDLAVTMPECDALGDFVVLPGLFEELRLAED